MHADNLDFRNISEETEREEGTRNYNLIIVYNKKIIGHQWHLASFVAEIFVAIVDCLPPKEFKSFLSKKKGHRLICYKPFQ